MLQENKINLSIIVPVFNEEQYLVKLFLDIEKFFNKSNISSRYVEDIPCLTAISVILIRESSLANASSVNAKTAYLPFVVNFII